MSSETVKPVVLAIDDTPENLDVVKGILAEDYKVKAATNGATALKLAQKQPPDIILLDIMMPEMDGYEVCRQLKANPITAEIPVIFLTAKDQTADEAEGFSLGAADYIHKPVNPPLLKARVKTHVALKQGIDELKALSQALAIAKERMEVELNVGRDIQKSMLPDASPDYPGVDLCASMRAAREVGGDFYDHFMLNDKELFFCVADVSGKGVGAALFMAMSKLLIKSRAADDFEPGNILTRVNNDLAQDNPECMFVTIFLARINLQTGLLTYANGGHNPPLIKRTDGAVEEVQQLHGPVLAIDDGKNYGQDQLQLYPGDTLVVFTDGITEAMDIADNLYSDERLVSTLTNTNTTDASTIMRTISESVDVFAEGAEQADDITMITLNYKG